MTVQEPGTATAEGRGGGRTQRAALLAGPAAALAFVGGALLAAALTPSLQWTTQPFDALGTVLHLSVVIGGLLGVAFVWAVWNGVDNRLQHVGAGLLGIALLMMALVNAIEVAFATFPEPAGLFGLLGFMLGAPAALLLSGVGDVVAGARRRGFASLGLWVIYAALWLYGFQIRALPVLIGVVWLGCISGWILLQYASLRA